MDYFSTPQAIYYVIILIFLVLGTIFRSEVSFFQVIKYLFIWCVLAFIVISFYSYRYDFLDFKNRIMGEINPSKAIQNNQGQVIINMSENGHFYIDVKINKKIIHFLIDTGASDMVINASDAIKIGIDLKKLNFNKPYQTANGRTFAANVILKEVEIGDTKFLDIPASVNSSDMGVSLLGMSFLKRCKKYEFYQNKLILTF